MIIKCINVAISVEVLKCIIYNGRCTTSSYVVKRRNYTFLISYCNYFYPC